MIILIVMTEEEEEQAYMGECINKGTKVLTWTSSEQ